MARFDFEGVFGRDYLHFYLPRLTDERNRAETAEIVELLGLEAGQRVLDAPCGHGRISNRLAEAGMVVTGVDSSDLFLDRARTDAATTGVEVDFRSGDLRRLPVRDGAFDAVVNWFTSFGYFDDEDNRAVLAEFRRVLHPGGVLLIETMYREGLVRNLPAAGQAHVERAGVDGRDLMVDSYTFDTESERLVTERVVVRDGRTSTAHYSVRLPALTELRAWLEAAGFASVRYQSRQGQPLSLESRRLVVLAGA